MLPFFRRLRFSFSFLQWDLLEEVHFHIRKVFALRKGGGGAIGGIFTVYSLGNRTEASSGDTMARPEFVESTGSHSVFV